MSTTEEQGQGRAPDAVVPPPKKAEPARTRSLEMLMISGIIFVLGGMGIDVRIILTAVISAVVVVATAISGRLRLISPKAVWVAQAAVIPAMIAFWMVWGYVVEDWRVVPTTEYGEDHPGYEHLSAVGRRAVKLEDASALRLERNSLRIDGATSLYDFYFSLGKAIYGVPNPGRISDNGTPRAYQELIDDQCDLIFVFRPSERQIAEARAKGREFKITPIGYDAFVFFVNQANPVDGLSARQLKDIYGGKLTNWRDAGGDDAKVIPFQRYANSGSQSRMERFMAGEKLMEPEIEHRFKHMMGIVTHVARYRNYRYAVGYSFLYYVSVMMEGGGVKLLSVDGVAPAMTTIRDGSYPLSEEICIVTAGSKNPHVEPFIDWALSAQGQAMLEEIGYVPIRSVPSGPDRPRVRRMRSSWDY